MSLCPLVPGERFELPTNGLQNRCSTTELTRQINGLGVSGSLLQSACSHGSAKRATSGPSLAQTGDGRNHSPLCRRTTFRRKKEAPRAHGGGAKLTIADDLLDGHPVLCCRSRARSPSGS